MSKLRVDEVVSLIEEMDQKEREELLLRLASIDDLLEDLEDIADLLHAAREQSKPFEDFLSELRAERGDLQA